MKQRYEGLPPDLRHYTFARNSGLPAGYFDPPSRWRKPALALALALLALLAMVLL